VSEDREQLRGVIASLLGPDQAGLGPDQAGLGPDQAGLGPDQALRNEPGLIDSAVRAASSTLERWSRGAPLRRLLGGIERDVLTSPGEWVALEASVGLPGKLAGKAGFMLDDNLVAEVDIGDGPEARAMIRAPSAGLYRVSFKLGPALPSVGHALLQVASTRPVILVDALLLLAGDGRSPPPIAPLLHAMVAADLELAYFDIGEKDSRPAIHEALTAHRLPLGACSSYAAEVAAVESLGVDLARLFGFAAVHRLRGKGVPVCAIVTERFVDQVALLGQIVVLTPDEARRRLDADGFASERVHVQGFLAERAAIDPTTWRLDRATGSQLVMGNSVIAELDNKRARERLFEWIDTARSSIHLQVYIIRSSSFADELVVRLIRRAREGVSVRLMVDALYSDQDVLGRNNPVLLALNAEANVEVLALGPIGSRRDVDVPRLKQRDHRKLVIVDGERALVSGRNAADPYYRSFSEVAIHDQTDHERIPWLDAHVELAGPIVSEVQRCFLSTWIEQGGTPPRDRSVLLPELARAGPIAARLVVHRGLVDANGLAMYESLLESAEHHVYIVNDFPIVSTLERAISRLLTRGIRVELLTGSAATRRADGSLFPAPVHRTLFEHMVKARLEPLMLAGVKVYEFGTPELPTIVARGGRVRAYVHAKMMSVDGRVCSVGSANLDATASFWESEANIVVEDMAFTSALEAELRELIATSFELDHRSDYWLSERAQRAVVSKLWPGSVYG
jgi:phosphatidylserine/phosphatidylglycerophosphate/cardiolipin synthase-like enzyme